MKTLSSSPDSGKISLQVDGDVVVLTGEMAHGTARDLLAPFFEQVHKAAEGLRVIKVDVRGLRLLSSSAVKELLGWVLKRNRMPPETKYAIEFIYDSTVLWQRVTMPTISHLDSGFIVLDDRGKTIPTGNA